MLDVRNAPIEVGRVVDYEGFARDNHLNNLESAVADEVRLLRALYTHSYPDMDEYSCCNK